MKKLLLFFGLLGVIFACTSKSSTKSSNMDSVTVDSTIVCDSVIICDSIQ